MPVVKSAVITKVKKLRILIEAENGIRRKKNTTLHYSKKRQGMKGSGTKTDDIYI